MARNTAIRGLQIQDAFFGDGIKRNSGDNNIAEVALKSSGGLKIDTAEIAVEPNDFAGDGLSDDGSDNLKVNVDDSTIETSGGNLQVKDDGITGAKLAAAVAGDGLAQDGSGNLDLDLNELTAAAVDVSADSIAIVDATDNSSKKETIADLVTAMAGSGLTATDGVLSADAITDNIVETDIKFEDESANCDGGTTDFTLDATPLTNSVQVYLNGLIQQEGSGKDYTLDGTTVSFATAPETGDLLLIHYIANN